MKKILFHTVAALLIAFGCVAQQSNRRVIITDTIRTEQALKTGNSLDVLTSFFQLALQDLGGEDKSFAFKSTLFGIKVRADSTLLNDYRFRQQRPARNTQFEIALHTNNNFRPVGISGGALYAIINERERARFRVEDSVIKRLQKRYEELEQNAYDTYLQEVYNKYGNTAGNPAQAQKKAEEIADFESAYRKYRASKEKKDFDVLPRSFQDAYNREKVLAARAAARHAIDSAMEDWTKRALLTVGLYGRTDSSSSRFREARLETVFLHGLGSRRVEADLRASAIVKDTVLPDKGLRYGFQFVGGANIVAIRAQRTKKSLLELKPNVEFATVLSKRYPGEENFFSFNMDVRVRITDQIWIPFIVKYDVDKKHFLGFLNVSANMDVFKGLMKM